MAVARSSFGSIVIGYILPVYGWRHVCTKSDHCGACRSDTVAVSDVIASSYAGYGAADASYWLCLMHHCLVLFVCDMMCSESSAETRWRRFSGSEENGGGGETAGTGEYNIRVFWLALHILTPPVCACYHEGVFSCVCLYLSVCLFMISKENCVSYQHSDISATSFNDVIDFLFLNADS